MTQSTQSMPSFTRYRVAAIQYDPTLGEKEKNVADLLRLVEEAASNGARLIVLPEMATTGYCWESRAEIATHVEPVPGPTTDRFAQLARQYDCYIAISFPEVDPTTNVYYNCMVLIGPQDIVGTYRKVHSYMSEPRWARDGDLGMPVWDTPLGRLAGLICMDAAYFESARIPALHSADVLLFPTNWFDDKCPNSWWMTRAFENGVYFIAANRYGKERGIQFSGGSCILEPDGSIQAYLDNGEGIVYGEVDLSRSRDKSWGPQSPSGESAGDRLADRRPDEYITLVNNTYLWEPLRYHSMYDLGELPPGQLSCVAIIQPELEAFQGYGAGRDQSSPYESQGLGRDQSGPFELLRGMLRALMRDAAPARPDVLVLPELMLPGPAPSQEMIAHFQSGAIAIPGPESEALVELAAAFQISLVLGVAEKVLDTEHVAGEKQARHPQEAPPPHPATPASTRGQEVWGTSSPLYGTSTPTYYNTVLLIDPEGIYGKYRKLHLTRTDRSWASPGNMGLPIFDTPAGRIGLATGYDVLFPETLRVLASKGVDLVCAPTLLNFPDPIGLAPTSIQFGRPVDPGDYDPTHYLIWRVRAAEHHVYLALANWKGQSKGLRANGNSGIFSPSDATYPWIEVTAEEGEPALTMMTIDTREQRTGRRSTTTPLRYAPGEMAGSLTGELDYDIRDSIPGNVVRSKPLLRKRMPFWYLDLIRTSR
jgi:predicted amidohydrolase